MTLDVIPLCALYHVYGIRGLILLQIITLTTDRLLRRKRTDACRYFQKEFENGGAAFITSEAAALMPPATLHGLFVQQVHVSLSKIYNTTDDDLQKKEEKTIKKKEMDSLVRCIEEYVGRYAGEDFGSLSRGISQGVESILLMNNNKGNDDENNIIDFDYLHDHNDVTVLSLAVEKHATPLLQLLLTTYGVDPSLCGWTQKTISQIWKQEWPMDDGRESNKNGEHGGKNKNQQQQQSPPPQMPNSLSIKDLSLLQLCLECGFPPQRPLAGSCEDFRTYYSMYKLSHMDLAGMYSEEEVMDISATKHDNFPKVLDAMIKSGWDVNAFRGRMLAVTTIKFDWKIFKLLILSGLRAHEVFELDPATNPTNPSTTSDNKTTPLLLAWDGKVMKNRHFWKHVLECEPLYDEFIQSWSPRAITLWMGISSTSVVYEAIIRTCRQQNRNPLELTFLLGNGRAVQQLSTHCGFGDTCKYVTQLLSSNPRINLGWAWSQLYEIDPHYFKTYRTEFKKVSLQSSQGKGGAAGAHTCGDIASEWPVFKKLTTNVQCALMPFILTRLQPPPPPTQHHQDDTHLKAVLVRSYVEGITAVDLNCLYTSQFDKINFGNSKGAAYKGEASRRFDGSVYPVEQLRGGIKRIVDVIIGREMDVASPNPQDGAEEFERYYAELEVYLRMVASELCAPTSAADKCATTLIYMGYCGLFCTDKWREMIHQVLCDLTDMADGDGSKGLSLSDRLAVLASNLRGMIAQDLSQKVNINNNVGDNGSNNVHFYHHYMYLMQDERAIYTGPFYTTPDKFCGRAFPAKNALIHEFDQHYTLERLYSELVIHYRALGQLRDLIHDWVRESMAERWNDPPFNKWEENLRKLQKSDKKFKSYESETLVGSVGGGNVTEEEKVAFLEKKAKLLACVFGQTVSEQDAQVARLPSCEGLTAMDLVKGINGRYAGTRAEEDGLKSIPPATFMAEVKREELSEITRPEELQYNIHPLVLLELLRSVGLVRYRTSAVFQGSFNNNQ
jgi:hypothetical protein